MLYWVSLIFSFMSVQQVDTKISSILLLDNDRLIGNGNKFDNKRCSSSTKKLILDRQNKMPAKTTPIKAVTPPVTVSFGARSGLSRTKSFKGESES